MGLLDLATAAELRQADTRVPRLDFELSFACDHKCGHCYNVWNADEGEAQAGYPKGHLDTADHIAMIEKAIRESGAEHVTITGGEPLLRKNSLDLIAAAAALVPSVQLITNGSHLGPDVIARLAELKLRSVQLTLLSADREEHDRLKGAVCFDDTVRALLDLVAAGVPAQVCFVSMAENWRAFEGVMELCFALGVHHVTYNRMSPTGWAIRDLDRLMPSVAQVEHNLATVERRAKGWKIKVSTAMPIPPCLIRLERYPSVRFGFCSVGSRSPNITIDALGNVRSCNLSAHISGNICEQPWSDIYRDPYLHTFKQQVPDVCKGCHYEQSCQGGCKESGYATYGDLKHPEPFLHRAGAGAGGEAAVAKPPPEGLAKVALAGLRLKRRGG